MKNGSLVLTAILPAIGAAAHSQGMQFAGYKKPVALGRRDEKK